MFLVAAPDQGPGRGGRVRRSGILSMVPSLPAASRPPTMTRIRWPRSITARCSFTSSICSRDQQRVIPMAAQMFRERWPVFHGVFPPDHLNHPRSAHRRDDHTFAALRPAVASHPSDHVGSRTRCCACTSIHVNMSTWMNRSVSVR